MLDHQNGGAAHRRRSDIPLKNARGAVGYEVIPSLARVQHAWRSAALGAAGGLAARSGLGQRQSANGGRVRTPRRAAPRCVCACASARSPQKRLRGGLRIVARGVDHAWALTPCLEAGSSCVLACPAIRPHRTRVGLGQLTGTQHVRCTDPLRPALDDVLALF